MTGNSSEVTMGRGGWWGVGFRIYFDVEMGCAFRVSRPLIALGDSGSADYGGFPAKEATGRKRGRKWPHTRDKSNSGSSSSPETPSSCRAI